MKRREFITLLGGAAVALPLAARAQQDTPVVGVLRINPKGSDIFAEPFRRYMQAAGWVEGRNVRYDFVWAEPQDRDYNPTAEWLRQITEAFPWDSAKPVCSLRSVSSTQAN